MKLEGIATTESIGILLTKCLTQGMISEIRQNAQVVLLHKQKIENYRSIRSIQIINKGDNRQTYKVRCLSAT